MKQAALSVGLTFVLVIGLPYLAVAQEIVPLTSGIAEPGHVGGDEFLAATQYVIEVPEDVAGLIIELENLGDGDIDLYVRFGQPLDTEFPADFESVDAGGEETIIVDAGSFPALQPGIYYIGVVNNEFEDQDFFITATVSEEPIARDFFEVLLIPGEVQQGTVPASEPGAITLSSTQYVIVVPEGAKSLIILLTNQGAGDIDLYIRLAGPIKISEGEIIADLSSISTTGEESIRIHQRILPSGRFYVVVQNLELTSQTFIIEAVIETEEEE
ncbi:MAG: PPC domain-containing protein [Candidatus Bipolaricaulia bacterium]